MSTWAGCEKRGRFTAISSLGQYLHVNLGIRSQCLFRTKLVKELRKESELAFEGEGRGIQPGPQARWGRIGQHIWVPCSQRIRGPDSLMKMLINNCSGWLLMQNSLELHAIPVRNRGVVASLWNTMLEQSIPLPMVGFKARAGEERIANAPRNSLSAWGPCECQLDSSSSLDLIH